jgi:hypothetical protein
VKNELLRALEILCARFNIEKQVIGGCGNVPLLTRWKLLVLPSAQVYLHLFNRSDQDREVHDHPFGFISLILWNGYIEVRPIAAIRQRLARGERVPLSDDPSLYERKRYYPGSLLIRPAWWAHRVQLVAPDKPSWSLVLRTPKQKDWGFFTGDGWRHWTRWQSAKICDDRTGTFSHDTLERLYGLHDFTQWVASGRATRDDERALRLTLDALRRSDSATVKLYGLTQFDVQHLFSDDANDLAILELRLRTAYSRVSARLAMHRAG